MSSKRSFQTTVRQSVVTVGNVTLFTVTNGKNKTKKTSVLRAVSIVSVSNELQR